MRARLQQVELNGKTYTFEIPWFIYDFNNDTHNFKGSLQRHVTIERVLKKIRGLLGEIDAVPGYNLFETVLDLLFGLNCNFRRKRIALYMIWGLKKGQYRCVEEVEA